MLRFQIEPKSFIIAAVIHLAEGVDIAPVAEGPDLLGEWGDTTADPDILRRYQAVSAGTRWGQALGSAKLHGLIFFNLRHRVPDWPLLTRGIQELLGNGPQYLFLGAGPAAKKLLQRRNQVRTEIHRLVGFTRLAPAPDGTMVGKAPVRHHSGDLVALALARRNPEQPLALLTPTGSWFAWQGRVAPLEDNYYDLPDDGFGQVWLTYYRSQFIRERNNPRHGARAIPQEYWHWLDEGKEMLAAKQDKA